MRSMLAALTALSLTAFSAIVVAVPTEITVRVLSKDAKFIGSSMGGMQVLLRDADTGELLAQGATAGGTGDTEKMVKQPRERHTGVATESAARFTATLDLDRPRLVELSVYGPLAQRQSAVRASATQWLVPGKHISGGDGWVIELPGFVVDVRDPPAHIKLEGLPRTVAVRANVTMMCGCPIEPGGLWDADRYEVHGLLRRNGEPAGEFKLAYAGETSQFAGEIQITEAGTYEATVYAYDPHNGNTGLDKVTFLVE